MFVFQIVRVFVKSESSTACLGPLEQSSNGLRKDDHIYFYSIFLKKEDFSVEAKISKIWREVYSDLGGKRAIISQMCISI